MNNIELTIDNYLWYCKTQKRLDEKMIDYKNTIDLVKREIESEDR